MKNVFVFFHKVKSAIFGHFQHQCFLSFAYPCSPVLPFLFCRSQRGLRILSWSFTLVEGKGSLFHGQTHRMVLLLACQLTTRTDSQAQRNADPDLQVMIKIMATRSNNPGFLQLSCGSQVLLQLVFPRIIAKDFLKGRKP